MKGAMTTEWIGLREELLEAVSGITKRDPVEYMGARLYVVGADEMGALRDASERLDGVVLETNKKSFGSWGILNLLNTDEPAIWYSLYANKQYMMVKDPAKSVPRLPKLIRIWENKMRKEFDLAMSEYGFDETEKAKALQKLEERIQKAKDGVLEIMSDPAGYEVWITNIERAKEYPFIHIRYEEGREYALLRQGVPNFLWLEEEEPSKGALSKNMKEIKEMENLFGDVYIARTKS